MLFHKTITKNNRIVNCQRQLQNDRNRIRYAGNRSHQVVCSLIQECSHTKRNQQYRDFHICLRGNQQYYYNNHNCKNQNQIHVIIQGFCLFFFSADRGRYVGIIIRKQLLYRLLGILADLIVFCAVKGHIKQGVRFVVMIRRIIKGNFLHTLYRLQLFHQRICVLPGNIRHHDPGTAICHKLFIHQGQTNSRLTVCRQIFCNILIYRYFIHACCTVNTRNGKQYQKSFSFVDNKGCYCQPKIPFFLFFFHSIHSLTSAFQQEISFYIIKSLLILYK